MLPVEIVSYESRIEHLFRVAAPLDDPELQAHLSRYICVLCSGYLEVSTTALLSAYASGKSAPRIAHFVERNLDQFQNPKMNKILDLLGRFDQQWVDDVRSDLRPELKDAVDSIVANRNQIVHGRQTSLSLARMKEYYSGATKVVRILSERCTG